MCVRCNYGEEKRPSSRPDFYSLEVRQFDYDGKTLGETTSVLEITKFRGTKRIDLLMAYPLERHRDSAQIRSRLMNCGRSFVSLIGMHHKQYEGIAFKTDPKLGIIKMTVKNRIMVDPKLMWQENPNYDRLAVGISACGSLEDLFAQPQVEGGIKGA